MLEAAGITEPPNRSAANLDSAQILGAPGQQAVAANEADDSSVGLKQTVAEFTSSLGAGITGAVGFGLSIAGRRGPLKAITIPLTLALAGGTKYGIKNGIEHALLEEKDRTASAADFAWGIVDGVAGIAGSAVEQRVSRQLVRHLGARALGSSISQHTASDAGKIILKNSAIDALKLNTVRGIAGGAAGTFTWSVPHRVHENWEELKTNPSSALGRVAMQTTQDTAMGSLFGGAFSGGFTAINRGKQLFGHARARVEGPSRLLQTDHRFIGDFHSDLDQLPHMKTKLDQLNAQSAARGIPSSFDITGDTISGHVNFAFTKGGKVEYESLIDMGAGKFILGNHEYDAAGGMFDVPRWAKVMAPILKKHPQVSVLNANMDFSAYPEYAGLTKPYVVEELVAPWGKTKVATVGLTTKEGALGAIKYNDAEAVAIQTIKDLNAQGIKQIILDTHLGLAEDIKLAQALIGHDLKVAGIMGGHSHSITPTPVWVGPRRSILDRLLMRTKGGDFEIPIMHSGPSGRWLGDFRPAMRPDGTAHRYHTTGKLHAITSDITPDAALQSRIEAALPERTALKQISYDATATGNYSNRDVRQKETALGNLISDAIRSGLRNELGDDILVMTHSGGIRSQIVAGKPITRLDLANLVMNAGKASQETQELVFVRIPGRYIKDGLEYGVRNMEPPTLPNLWKRIAGLFVEQQHAQPPQPGNFVQVSGMRYTIDLTKPAWEKGAGGGRVTSVKVQNGENFENLDPLKLYSVVTRRHPIHKWWQAGVFGDKPFEQVAQDLKMQDVQKSQVDLIGEYIRGKSIDPRVFSPVEGRIVNVTKDVPELTFRPARSVGAFPAVGEYHRQDKKS